MQTVIWAEAFDVHYNSLYEGFMKGQASSFSGTLRIPFKGTHHACAILSATVKSVLDGHSQKDQHLVLKTNYRLRQVESVAECSKRSILQYLRPSLSYHLP